jgi:hypothetical protein
MMMATGYFIKELPGRGQVCKDADSGTGGDQRAKWYHGLGGFSEKFSAQKAQSRQVFYGGLCCGLPLREKNASGA